MGPTTGRLDEYESIDAHATDEESDDIEATRAQIEQTRAEMSGTIDAIKDKLSPQNLMDQAKETVREATVGKVHQVADNVKEGAKRAASSAVEGAERVMNNASDTAREAGSTFIETIQRNPIPSALIGVGLGWLWMNTRKQASDTPRYGRPLAQDNWRQYGTGYDYSGYQAGVGASAASSEEGQSRMGEMTHQVQEKAGEITERVQEKAGEITQRVQEKASYLGAQAQERAQRAGAGIEQLMYQNPLAMGAVALTLGAAVGMAVPETRQENRIMGEARDRVVEKAQQATQEVAQKVQTVAQEAMGTAREEVRAQGLTG
jgi:ElaB/YqjD/DUF883 family membrane-anchored ribosome-binding protein